VMHDAVARDHVATVDVAGVRGAAVATVIQ